MAGDKHLPILDDTATGENARTWLANKVDNVKERRRFPIICVVTEQIVGNNNAMFRNENLDGVFFHPRQSSADVSSSMSL